MEIRTNYYEIKTDLKVKATIVNIADFHVNLYTKLFDLNNLYDLLLKISPNVIVFTGDLIDSLTDFNTKLLLDFINKIIKIARVFIVLDWHDYLIVTENGEEVGNYDNLINKLRETSAHLFMDKEVIPVVEGINILGCSFTPLLTKNYHRDNKEYYDYFNNYNKDLKLSDDQYNILLIHNPQIFFDHKIELTNINLILAGHMHGGLLPKLTSRVLISPERKWFNKKISGMTNFSNYKMIVSRGYLKMPLTAGKIFYKFNKLYKNDIDIIKIN